MAHIPHQGPDIYDGHWRLFSYDPEAKSTVWVLHHEGGMTFRTDVIVDDILKANHEAARDADGKRWGEFVRVASIPLDVFHSSGFAEAHRQHDKAWLKRFLNDSDNRAWRTKDGTV